MMKSKIQKRRKNEKIEKNNIKINEIMQIFSILPQKTKEKLIQEFWEKAPKDMSLEDFLFVKFSKELPKYLKRKKQNLTFFLS